MMPGRSTGRGRGRWLALLPTLALVALLAPAAPVAASQGGNGRILPDLIKAFQATARFRNVTTAEKAGYAVRVADAAGLTCITDLGDTPSEGGMGVHYLDPGLAPELGDPTVKPSVSVTHPELLVYEPQRNGSLRLVALEYLTLAGPWNATHPAAPKLFGHTFDYTPAGNRFGLPAYYSLHVWLYKFNPSGLFKMWNPRVDCADAAAPDLKVAKTATRAFRSLEVAKKAGYSVEVADLAGLTCIADLADTPSEGGMGVHYLDPAQIPELTDPTFTGTPSVDPAHPELLVYAPDSHGHLHLVALEYLTLAGPWDATHSAPPMLFDQPFDYTPAGNRFGLPAYYSLHAWIYKSNPSGMFEMWNPRVHCPSS